MGVGHDFCYLGETSPHPGVRRAERWSAREQVQAARTFFVPSSEGPRGIVVNKVDGNMGRCRKLVEARKDSVT